jgi:hypothetical protein
MNWSKGMILASVTYKDYHGVIQRIEGKSVFYVKVDTPGKEEIIQEGINSWEDAEKWVERKIYELASNKQSI